MGETSSSNAPEMFLVSDVRPGPGHTFYSMVGDWFAWINLIASLVLFSTIFRKAAKQRTHNNRNPG
jgi:apolipoprotein N-acyltransferase